MVGMFEDYPHARAWDEMLAPDGTPRQGHSAIVRTLATLSVSELVARAETLAGSYVDQGVTFDHAGVEKAFPLDVIPRIIRAEEWEVIEAGVQQRVRALEALLDDVYAASSDAPRAVRAGIIPWKLIASSEHFHREVAGIAPSNGARIQVAGVDLVRDESGTLRVLEDNVRVPSGVSYVISNRHAMTNVIPEAFVNERIRPVDSYPSMLLAALRAAAPAGVSDPTVVVLTPGVYNSAYYEHSLLARTMGVELVEGRDLFVSGGNVRMRTTQGDRQVDVIYRRVDDEFLDPVHFRPDSALGCPGLIQSLRAGRVSVANAIGNGVADDKLMYSYIPELTRFYLDEDPILPNVDTFRPIDPAARRHILDHLDQMVVKPVAGSGGKGIVIGSRATGAQLDEVRRCLLDSPRDWIAQPEVQLSTVPTLVDGRVRPRHVDLRPFAVNDGERVRVLPGGLTRVALPEGELIVNSSQGGGSKDTWVLASARQASISSVDDAEPPTEVVVLSPPPVFRDDQARSQQQQQEQQQQSGGDRRAESDR